MNPLEHAFKKLTTLRLPPAARTRMRAELSSYADLHSVLAHAPTPRAFSAFSIFSSRTWMALAAIVLVIGSAGGTAYASGGALPGDALYPIKVRVAEPVQTALIPSPRGKAAWHAILAERRLEEATQLAVADKLSADTQADISVEFSSQVEATMAEANHLERSGDPNASLDVRSDLEARITAHEHILGTIVSHDTVAADASTEESADSAEATRTFLAVVQKSQDDVESSRIALEGALLPRGANAAAKASTTADVAIAVAEPHTRLARTRVMFNAPAAAHIEHTEVARTEEIRSILAKNATLLAAFAPFGTTTASTTVATSTDDMATTTATTTEEKMMDR